MPDDQPLIIVPVTLHPTENTNQNDLSATPFGVCTITLAHAEITFQNGVEERIIQTIIRELMNQ